MGRSGLIGAGEIAAGIALNATGVAVPLGQRLTILGATTLASAALNKTPGVAVKGGDLGQNANDPVEGLPIPYGQCLVGFSRQFATTHAPGSFNNRYLWLIGALCHGPVEQVLQVYLDDHLALQADGPFLRSVWDGASSSFDYRALVAGWIAYGSDGQNIAVMNSRGSIAVSASVRFNYTDSITGETTNNARQLTTSSAHPYKTGDCIQADGVTGLDRLTGYIVLHVPDSTHVIVYNSGGESNVSGGGGNIDYYSPDLWNTFYTLLPGALPTQIFTNQMTGKGIVWLVLRLSLPREGDQNVFNANIPRVTALVNGIVGDSNVLHGINTLAIANVSQGPAFTIPEISVGSQMLYAQTAYVDFSTAHNLAEGMMLRFSGTGSPLDGTVQRVDRVISTTRVRLFVDTVTATYAGGSANLLDSITNPMVAVREYLTNKNYGPAVAASELNDSMFSTAASYCEDLVQQPFIDYSGFQNTRAITGIITWSGGTQTVLQCSTPGLGAGVTILVTGCSNPVYNGYFTIVGTGGGGVIINVPFSATSAPYGAIQKQITAQRFLCAGQLNSNDTIKQNIETLLGTCRGRLTFQSGKWRPTIRASGSPGTAITQKNLRGAVSLRLPGMADMANVLRATNVNAPEWLDTLLVISSAANTPSAGFTRYFVNTVQGYIPGDQILVTGVRGNWGTNISANGLTSVVNVDPIANSIDAVMPSSAAGAGGSIRKVIVDNAFGTDGQYSQILWPTGGLANNPYYVADGNQLNMKDVEMPLVNNPFRAQQLLMTALRELRNAYGLDIICDESMLDLSPDDLVSFTHESFGFVAVPFWVGQTIPLADSRVQVTLESYNPAAYDLTQQDDAQWRPKTALPDPLIIDPPTGMAVTAHSDRMSLTVSWTPSDSAHINAYQVQYALHATDNWVEARQPGVDATSVDINGLASNKSYDVRMRAIAGLNKSAWVEVDGTNLPDPIIPLSLSATPIAPSVTDGSRVAYRVTMIDPVPQGDNTLKLSIAGGAIVYDLGTTTVATSPLSEPTGGATSSYHDYEILLPTDAPQSVIFTLTDGGSRTPVSVTVPAPLFVSGTPGPSIDSISVTITHPTDDPCDGGGDFHISWTTSGMISPTFDVEWIVLSGWAVSQQHATEHGVTSPFNPGSLGHAVDMCPGAVLRTTVKAFSGATLIAQRSVDTVAP